MKGYLENLDSDTKIISKVAVQTGTSHGGQIDKEGNIEKMTVDFSILESIGKIAKEEYKMAGTVQHGASTLPNEEFDKFPKVGTAEIHLATGFQNIIYDTMPINLREKLERYVVENLQKERKEGWTDEQLIYRMRKKAIGPHKKDLWLISEPDKEVIRKRLSEEFEILFQKLNIVGTAHTVRKYVGKEY
jgi:fructose/tagatose bisphosphate aldolase